MARRATSSLFLITILVFGYACKQVNQDKTIINGDLYFGLFRFGSFYNQPDSLIKAFENFADTLNQINLTAHDKKLLTTFHVLKKENLLYNPFVELRLKNDSTITLYLDKAEYDKIKVYKRRELQENNKKVKIFSESKDLGHGLFFCTKLISVDRVDGMTLEVQRKFKIEDYE